MAGNSENQNQERAIAALLSGPTIAQAAVAAGISERTMFRYLQDPTFQKAFREARSRSITHAIARLQFLASESVEVLSAVLHDPEGSSSSKVQAVKLILDLGTRDDYESRLSAIEARLSQLDLRKGGPEAWQKMTAGAAVTEPESE